MVFPSRPTKLWISSLMPLIMPHITTRRNGKLHILCMIDGMNAASILETAQ